MFVKVECRNPVLNRYIEIQTDDPDVAIYNCRLRTLYSADDIKHIRLPTKLELELLSNKRAFHREINPRDWLTIQPTES